MEYSSPDNRLRNGLVLTAALSLTAYLVRRKAKQAERRFPPAGRFIEVDGIRLHYLDAGSGPAVLLLHGNGDQAADFVGCGLFEALAARHRVVAIDRPGFGYSARPRDRLWTPQAQARLIERACAALGIEQPLVLGHSFGTLVALSLALETALPVRGLVLVSGYYYPTFRLDALLLAPPAIPLLGDLMRYTVSPLLGGLLMHRMRRRIFHPRAIDRRFVASVPGELMLRPWQIKAAAEDSAFMVPAAAKLARRYEHLRVPVEIFAGEEDRMVHPERQSIRLRARIPHSRLHLVAGEGHMLHYDVSREIADAIDRIAAEAAQAVAAGAPQIAAESVDSRAAPAGVGRIGPRPAAETTPPVPR